jgi:hypothetical protein
MELWSMDESVRLVLRHEASVQLRRDLHRTAMQAAQVRTPCPWCGLCPQSREPRGRRVRLTPRDSGGRGLFGRVGPRSRNLSSDLLAEKPRPGSLARCLAGVTCAGHH